MQRTYAKYVPFTAGRSSSRSRPLESSDSSKLTLKNSLLDTWKIDFQVLTGWCNYLGKLDVITTLASAPDCWTESSAPSVQLWITQCAIRSEAREYCRAWWQIWRQHSKELGKLFDLCKLVIASSAECFENLHTLYERVDFRFITEFHLGNSPCRRAEFQRRLIFS